MLKQRDKLILYSKFAVAYLLIHSEAYGQAVYTDLEPDIVLSDGDDYFALDIDDSGGYDFVFFNWTDTTYSETLGYKYLERLWVGPYALNYAAVAGISNYISTAGYRYYPYALATGAIVNNDLSFQNWFYQRMAFRSNFYIGTIPVQNDGGFWYPEVLDHYLGVRFVDSEDCLHYGWIRCDVKDEGRTLIIKDYAYELKCDTPFAVGDTVGDTTTVSITEINTLDAIVYSFDNSIYVNLNELANDVEIYVYDLMGKEVYSGVLINQSAQVKLNEAKGIYFVEIVSDNRQFTKKIYLN